jgi:hypothetical protein
MRRGRKAKELRNAVIAALQTYSTVIALIDARAEEVAELEDDIREILAQCREKAGEARVAIGLAIQEIEIWMLADPASRVAAFGPAVGQQAVPADLESVDDPKALWLERAGQAPVPEGKEASLHADNQRLAAWEALRPEVVAYGCPRGFAPFEHALADALPWLRE